MDEEPIEILVGMAERGEIDPWNIDILEVTDRFLSELERLRQLDLRISGRTLFYAATLLRLKSEYLEEPEEEEPAFPEDDGLPADDEDEFSFDPSGYYSPVERLEKEIQRRLDRRAFRKRPVTLYELIKLLKTAEKEERRRHRAKIMTPEVLVTADDVISTAHSEDYRESSTRVWNDCETLLSKQEDLTLQDLAEDLEWKVADVYIPLLFLNLEGKISLSQDALFSEIFIRRRSESS